MENTPEQGNSSTLIDLQALSKVFYTEEVETHALSDIHLEVKAGAVSYTHLTLPTTPYV